MEFKTLIVCKDHWDNVAEIPFVLTQAGCSVEVYCSKYSWLISNKYYSVWHESSSNSEEEFVEGLLKLVRENSFDWVIFADDLAVRLVNNAFSDEDFLRIKMLTKPENRFVLSSKIGLSEFCKANEIPTPNFAIYNNENDFEKIKKLNFPVINKIDFSWSGSGMFISDTFDFAKIFIGFH